MKLHILDGTYELFRCYFGAPSSKTSDGREVGATRALIRSLTSLMRSDDVSHIACAFDHVIESFRNQLFDGYKTGDGIDPDLFSQFPLAERAVRALGITVWSMIEFEADDALATAAHRFSIADPSLQVIIASPDKDLAQCVKGNTVMTWDRLRKTYLDEAGVIAKFGVPPCSIPDLLALVGDTADGIPGIPRWGAKSAAKILARYGSIERIPQQASQWDVGVRGAEALAESLVASFDDAILYRQLATLRIDVPLAEEISDLKWHGVDLSALTALADEIEDPKLVERMKTLGSQLV